jgi:hypothetical protein
MNSVSRATTPSGSAIPCDDFKRNLISTRSDDPNAPHIELVGDTYTNRAATTGPEAGFYLP